MVDPRVGFVVIGRNEGERLRDCLRSMLSLSDRIIYSDSNSTDGSPASAESLGITTVVSDPQSLTSAARGRNAGVAALREKFPDCEFVQFVDGDCILVPSWPQKALRFLQEHRRVAVVCGRRFERDPNGSFYNWLMDQEWNTPVGPAEACGGDSMVRISALQEIDGFRSELSAGEEPEMCARLRAAGWDIWRLDEPMSEHDARIHHFSQWWLRAKRSGFGYAQVWSATARLPNRLYGRILASITLWVVAVPLLVALLAMATGSAWPLLLLPIAYGIQIARMAMKRGAGSGRSWRAAAIMFASKFAEILGAANFFALRGGAKTFEYKPAPRAGANLGTR